MLTGRSLTADNHLPISESPSKKSKLEVDEAADGSGEEMDVQDTNEDDKPKQNDDQEMSAEDDSLLVASDLKSETLLTDSLWAYSH